MRLTTRTNLAMRALMFCAVNDDRIVRKHEIAVGCNASENHLAQVVNTLAQQGFVETHRGRSGGLRLARPPEAISVGAVFRAFETGSPFAECFEPDSNTCPLTATCRLRVALAAALESFYAALDRISLRDLVEDNTGLETILRLHDNRRQRLCA
ncbi:MAG: RrF2 family transcriptional regulator [Pseudomonadota bacterium]